MSAFGKTIRLFLIDGTPNGLITAELSNWTGIGVKVPRIKLNDYGNRPEFQKPGVYILLSKGEIDNEAYIGEAEVIYTRLKEQVSKKEFWNEAVFFGSKDKYLNKASIKYLENRLHDLAMKAGRYNINQNIPTKSELSEAEQAELEEFLANIKVLTATLGHNIFETLEETIKTDHQSTIFYCKNGAGANASGIPSTEGFIVFKGALMMQVEQKSLAPSLSKERVSMLETGVLILDNGFYRLTKDYLFSSSSRAVDAVLARSASGPMEWKTAEGIQLKKFEQ